MSKYKIGQRVRCISDDDGSIKPGTILTITGSYIGHKSGDKLHEFEGIIHSLYSYEIEPLNRTIRDVEIGDVFEDKHFNERKVIDVGKHGLVDEFETYFSWSEAEDYKFKIKQPEQEKQEIKKTDGGLFVIDPARTNITTYIADVFYKDGVALNKKVNEIIEVVNKIVKE